MVVEELIAKLEEGEWSDLHFSPGNFPSARVKGEIVQFPDIAGGRLSEEDTKNIKDHLLSFLTDREAKIAQEKIESDSYGHAGFSITVQGKRFRVNLSRLGNGYHIVMRLLASEPPDLRELGFNERTCEALEYVLTRREGLFLVVGATGSGKSTTLASMVKEINKRFALHIITLEDPIEYLHSSRRSVVVQKELGRDFPSFQEGLHSALREDPDVILVGEVRDPKSFELCLKASETGHLVLATLHTQDTLSTINRLVALGSHNPDLTRDRLAQVLVGIIAQKLFLAPSRRRRVCWEILIPSKGIKAQIRKNEIEQIRSMLDNTPMSQSFNKTIRELYMQGLVDRGTAIALSPDPQNLNLGDFQREEAEDFVGEMEVI